MCTDRVGFGVSYALNAIYWMICMIQYMWSVWGTFAFVCPVWLPSYVNSTPIHLWETTLPHCKKWNNIYLGDIFLIKYLIQIIYFSSWIVGRSSDSLQHILSPHKRSKLRPLGQHFPQIHNSSGFFSPLPSSPLPSWEPIISTVVFWGLYNFYPPQSGE